MVTHYNPMSFQSFGTCPLSNSSLATPSFAHPIGEANLKLQPIQEKPVGIIIAELTSKTFKSIGDFTSAVCEYVWRVVVRITSSCNTFLRNTLTLIPGAGAAPVSTVEALREQHIKFFDTWQNTFKELSDDCLVSKNPEDCREKLLNTLSVYEQEANQFTKQWWTELTHLERDCLHGNNPPQVGCKRIAGTAIEARRLEALWSKTITDLRRISGKRRAQNITTE